MSNFGPADLRQILDELIIAGELQESSKKAVLRIVSIFSNFTSICGEKAP
jgi:hypothetical protein